MFSVAKAEGTADSYTFRITMGYPEKDQCVSFVADSDLIKRLHRSFDAHRKEEEEEEEEEKNSFVALKSFVKKKLHIFNEFTYPHTPLYNKSDPICIEAYQRELEDFFNLLYLDHAYLFQEQPFFHMKQFTDLDRHTITQLIQESQMEKACEPARQTDPSIPTSHQNIGWLMAQEKIKRNGGPVFEERTKLFQTFLDEWEAGTWTLPHSFKDEYVLLFVPGLFTGLYARLVGYFDDNMAPFLRRNITAMKVPINTFASIHTNAIEIEKKIESILEIKEHAHKKIILIGHSKGGVDCISTLALSKKQLISSNRIGGCICIQSPYAGCPFARSVGIRASKGNDDLTYAARKNFLELHPFDANECDFPIISLVSEMSAPSGSMARNIKQLQEESGFLCDGLVVPVDGIVPDSIVVHLKDIDHANMAFTRLRLAPPKYRLSPSSLTVAACRLLFEHNQSTTLQS